MTVGNRQPHNHLVPPERIERSELLLRVLELKLGGLSVRAVGERVAREYGLRKVPAASTVAQWLDEAVANPRGRELKEQFMALALARLEKLTRRHFAVAANPTRVVRKVKVGTNDGQPVYEDCVDADGYKEALAATDAVRANTEAARKLLGIGTANDKQEPDEKPLTPTVVNAIINKTVVAFLKGEPLHPAAKAVFVPMAGVPELEDL